MKTIKVNIGGKEYSLAGDNEQLVRQTANEVDSQMVDLVGSHGELADDKALPILTALNIAEAKILQAMQADNDRSFVVDELKKMTESLKQSLEKYV